MKPNLFIIGAAKSGTTTLYHYLKQHPDIYMSPIKEPHHFAKDISPDEFRRNYKKQTKLNKEKYFNATTLKEKHIAFIENIDDYLLLYKDAINQKYLGETSTGYLYSKVAASEIYKFNPESKIIIILRSPIDRTISHYNMDLASGNQKEKNILTGLKKDYNKKKKGWGITNLYIELSQYEKQIERYKRIFDDNQILLLDFQELKSNPQILFSRIWNFLNIPEIILKTNEIKNKTLLPKNPLIHRFLLNIFPKNIVGQRTKDRLKNIFLKSPDSAESINAKEYLDNALERDIKYYANCFKTKK